VLDLSKLEAQELRVQAESFVLGDMLKAVYSTFKPSVEAKGITLSLTVDDALPSMVVGDSFRPQQVLRNLLSNAVKFTETGEISISVQRLDQGVSDKTTHENKQQPEQSTNNSVKVRFSIKDSGIGIDADTQENLFEPFIQADSSSTRQYGGTGLGLTISRRIVELMDGEIDVESTPGKG